MVFDETSPTLEIQGSLNDKYHLNDVITIPGYSVSDNQTNVSVDVILIMPTNEARILSHFNRSLGIDGKITESNSNALDRKEYIKVFDTNGKLVSEETKDINALKNNALYNSSFVVSSNSVRLEMKGKYTLRFVAYDNEYNRTVKEFVFNAY